MSWVALASLLYWRDRVWAQCQNFAQCHLGANSTLQGVELWSSKDVHAQSVELMSMLHYVATETLQMCQTKNREMENHPPKKDTIVAIGYADRQRAETLKLAGRVNTEL